MCWFVFGRTLPHNQVAHVVGKNTRTGSDKLCPDAKADGICFSHMAQITQNITTVTDSKDKTMFRECET